MDRPTFYLTIKRQSYKALVRELRRMGLNRKCAKQIACSALETCYRLDVEFNGQLLRIRNLFNRAWN